MATNRRGLRGETIVEALVSILIAALVFAFLTNAVVVAARINTKIRNEDTSIQLDDNPTVQEGNVAVRVTGESSPVAHVNIYATNGEGLYHYYEYIADTP